MTAARDINKSDITNETYKGFSNFHTSRTRIYFDAAIGSNSAVFVQLLIDNSSLSIYGAFARFENLYHHYLNVQIGFIPMTVGTYAPRTYSNTNPLIGTPLLYNYHSAFRPMRSDPVGDIDNLLSSREPRSNGGLPVIYDACWNTGVEIYGNSGSFGYSIGAVSGSISKPFLQQLKNIPQFTSRLFYSFGPELEIGINGFYGPYIAEQMLTDSLPSGKSAEDYMSAGGGYDLYFARGYFEIHSEAFFTMWEYPTLPDLKATSGYGEVKYKVLPGWYLAGRFGWFTPLKVSTSGGTRERWDYAVTRYELGAGHWFSRSVVGKLVGQINRFEKAAHLDNEIVALQLAIMIQ